MVRRSGAPGFWGGLGEGGLLVSLAGKLRRRRATEACTSAAKLPSSHSLPPPPLGLALLPTGLHSLLTCSLVLLLLAHVGEREKMGKEMGGGVCVCVSGTRGGWLGGGARGWVWVWLAGGSGLTGWSCRT